MARGAALDDGRSVLEGEGPELVEVALGALLGLEPCEPYTRSGLVGIVTRAAFQDAFFETMVLVVPELGHDGGVTLRALLRGSPDVAVRGARIDVVPTVNRVAAPAGEPRPRVGAGEEPGVSSTVTAEACLGSAAALPCVAGERSKNVAARTLESGVRRAKEAEHGGELVAGGLSVSALPAFVARGTASPASRTRRARLPLVHRVTVGARHASLVMLTVVARVVVTLEAARAARVRPKARDPRLKLRVLGILDVTPSRTVARLAAVLRDAFEVLPFVRRARQGGRRDGVAAQTHLAADVGVGLLDGNRWCSATQHERHRGDRESEDARRERAPQSVVSASGRLISERSDQMKIITPAPISVQATVENSRKPSG